MSSNRWTKESDRILLELNDHSLRDVEIILNELIGPNEKEWIFLGNPRIYVNPAISVKLIRKEEIIGILKSNNLLWLPQGF